MTFEALRLAGLRTAAAASACLFAEGCASDFQITLRQAVRENPEVCSPHNRSEANGARILRTANRYRSEYEKNLATDAAYARSEASYKAREVFVEKFRSCADADFANAFAVLLGRAPNLKADATPEMVEQLVPLVSSVWEHQQTRVKRQKLENDMWRHRIGITNA